MRAAASAIVTAFAAVIGISSASAADLAARPYTRAPMIVEPAYNWTGFYVGGNAGYSWGRSNTDVSFFDSVAGTPIVPPAGSITSGHFDMNGGIAGGQAGYNWQLNNYWLLGFETDIQWSGERGRAAFNCAGTVAGGVCLPGLTFLPPGATGTNVALAESLDWFGTARGRVGYLVMPNVLLYGTLGAAYGSINTSGALSGFNPNGAALALAGSNSDTRLGWTAGAGIEGMITANWSAKLEFLYMDFGRFNTATFTLGPGSPIAVTVSSKFTDNILRAGINYKFGGPVVARY